MENSDTLTHCYMSFMIPSGEREAPPDILPAMRAVFDITP